jgi:hypothetical protein
VKPLSASDFGNGGGARLGEGLRKKLTESRPLGFSILREAEANGSGRLTGVGGRVVAEVFHRAREGSRHSIVRDPFWRPFLSPVAERNAKDVFEMTDLMPYAFEGRADLLPLDE